MTRDESELDEILAQLPDMAAAGGDAAVLLRDAYVELRALAESMFRGERADHTLQATALVHEAYLRLVRHRGMEGVDREAFLRMAATTMRRILVDHARRVTAQKRGGRRRKVSLSETAVLLDDSAVELLDLNDALERLHEVDDGQARLVELRFFAGCTIDQAAAILGISAATAERWWRFARAWLKVELADAG